MAAARGRAVGSRPSAARCSSSLMTSLGRSARSRGRGMMRVFSMTRWGGLTWAASTCRRETAPDGPSSDGKSPPEATLEPQIRLPTDVNRRPAKTVRTRAQNHLSEEGASEQ
jgi:hypothetical protein